MDLRSDRCWWDELSDADLLDALDEVGVQDVVARNIVRRRDDPSARVRLRLELGEGPA